MEQCYKCFNHTPFAISIKQSSIEFWREIFKSSSCCPTDSTVTWRLFLRCLHKSETDPISASTAPDLICLAKFEATWMTHDLNWGSCETFLWSRWRITEAKTKCWLPEEQNWSKSHPIIISVFRYNKSRNPKSDTKGSEKYPNSPWSIIYQTKPSKQAPAVEPSVFQNRSR